MSSKVRSVAKRIVQHPAANGSGRPAPYRIWQYGWHCSSDGFCIEARSNLSLKERDDFLEADDAITAYSKEWIETPDEERDHEDTPRRRQIELLLPYIRDWNAVGIDAVTGEEKPLPSPAVAGIDAFQLITADQGVWVITEITNAYRWGKGLTFSSFDQPSEATAETLSAGEPDGPSSKTSNGPTTPDSSDASTVTT